MPTISPDLSSPEKSVAAFVAAFFDRDWDALSQCVQGSVPVGLLSRGKFPPIFADSIQRVADLHNRFPDVEVKTYLCGDGEALVRFRWAGLGPYYPLSHYFYDHPPESGNLEDLILLQREENCWKVVPEARQAIHGMLNQMAFTCQQYQPSESIHSLSNVKSLCLAAMMHIQFHDQVFAFPEGDWKTALMSFIRDERLFTSPLDPPGTQSYRFNERLLNRDATQIPEPSRTVLFFEGEWGNPHFRYGEGDAVIGFVDGHAERIAEKENGSLRWEP